MKFKSLILLAGIFSLGFLSSCDKDDEEVENTSTYPVSGEWVVAYYEEENGQLVPQLEGLSIYTYNTAANNGTEMWVDDRRTFWEYKVKTPVNVAARTFSGNELQNVTYDSKVRITDGKVLQGATKVHGVTADSIYFKVAFDDDSTPYGHDYIISGHRVTGGH